MKKLLFIILTLIISLFILIKGINYIKSIEDKVNSITSIDNYNEPLTGNVKTSHDAINSLNFEKPDFVQAANKTIDNVVHVKNSSNISNGFSIQDLIFGKKQRHPLIGTGSGVIISPDGYIITNSHCYKEC